MLQSTSKRQYQDLKITVKEIRASKIDKKDSEPDMLHLRESREEGKGVDVIDRTKSNVYYQSSDGFVTDDGQTSCASFSVTLYDIPMDSGIEIRYSQDRIG